MNKKILRAPLFGFFIFSAFTVRSQSVGINTTAANPAASAILDLSTGNTGHAGFLAPQVSITSNTDNATIPAPATGLIIYNKAAGVASGLGYYFWTGAPLNIWAPMGGSAGQWLLTGNSNTSSATNWIGTNDAQALQIYADGKKSGWIDYTTPFLTSFGWESANVNTGADNTAIGYQTLLANAGATDNTAVGYLALTTNTAGGFNTAVGSGALQVSTGSNSTAVGYDALYKNTGPNNTAVGYSSLFSNTTGQNNTALGYNAAISSTNQNDVSAFGTSALQNNLAALNTGVGYSAGLTNTAGSQNTYIGAKADANANSYTNSTAVGYSSYIGANNVMILGSINGVNGAGADVNVGIGTITPSQKLNVQNGNMLISNSTATAAQIQLQGTGAGISTFQSGAQGATNYNWTMPTVAPVVGQIFESTTYVAPAITTGYLNQPTGQVIGLKVITSTQAAVAFDVGTTFIVYTLIGGGGAGGGVSFTAPGCISSTASVSDMCGSGGGAGGYSNGVITGLNGAASTYAVTIGAGGVGQATCSPTPTATGGTTFLTLTNPGVTVSAGGGGVGGSLEVKESIGAFSRLVGGSGGTCGNANAENETGQIGGYATITMNGTDAAEAGQGAGSFFGGDAFGYEERDASGRTGWNASNYGAGGGGATYAGVTASGQTATGGNGFQGIVVIYEYR